MQPKGPLSKKVLNLGLVLGWLLAISGLLGLHYHKDATDIPMWVFICLVCGIGIYVSSRMKLWVMYPPKKKATSSKK